MKHFSKHWISSKKPKKQRKYRANAPKHIKRKLITSNLSKELRKTYKKRSLVLIKKDSVKVMRGQFKKKSGKIIGVNTVAGKVFIENIQKTKKDGTKINVPFDPSNLQITELNLEDKKRLKKPELKQNIQNKAQTTN
jgi:large subunit ribosomal protein L24